MRRKKKESESKAERPFWMLISQPPVIESFKFGIDDIKNERSGGEGGGSWRGGVEGRDRSMWIEWDYVPRSHTLPTNFTSCNVCEPWMLLFCFTNEHKIQRNTMDVSVEWALLLLLRTPPSSLISPAAGGWSLKSPFISQPSSIGFLQKQ